MRKFPFTEILGWSASRYDVFTTCKRQYYYTYYGKFDKEFDKHRISRLKNLTTQALESGWAVHEVIAAVLNRLVKDARPLDRERLIKYLHQLVDDQSSEREFFEVYYGSSPEPDLQGIKSTAQQSLEYFLDSERFEWIREKAANRKDEWIIEPEGFGETRIDGLKAYCKVDFMLPDAGKVYIFDWKSGKAEPEKHRRQVIGYAVFAHANYGFPEESIHPVLSYLKEGYREVEVMIQSTELPAFSQQVRRETEEMYAYTSDTPRNIPLEKEKFPLMESARLCAYCSFRELCSR